MTALCEGGGGVDKEAGEGDTIGWDLDWVVGPRRKRGVLANG